MKDSIILIGSFIEIIELCQENDIVIAGLVDIDKKNEYSPIPVIGSEININAWKNDYNKFKIIITPDEPNKRKELALFYTSHGFNHSKIISRHARISKSAIIQSGSVVQAGANISSEVTVGEFVKINNNANVMHNAEIGDFTTIAPNAVILGYVKIGQSCYIGSNATILPNLYICDNVIVGAGSVVTKNINTPFSVYTGIPARFIKFR
jgi:sugar O-acyltransferase (sialic acid O-acetyltransferase NeuD family)